MWPKCMIYYFKYFSIIKILWDFSDKIFLILLKITCFIENNLLIFLGGIMAFDFLCEFISLTILFVLLIGFIIIFAS